MSKSVVVHEVPSYGLLLRSELLFISDETELQCVPGHFESEEEYVKVFEPLLFEECRAQLYSTWEEMAESGTHVKVHVKNIERRERGMLRQLYLYIYFVLFFNSDMRDNFF